MEAGTEQTGSAALERELAELLDQERFPPPQDFREAALWNDPAVYEEAERDPVGFWERQAEALEWFEPWDRALDDSNPPFFKWFVGGRLNA